MSLREAQRQFLETIYDDDQSLRLELMQCDRLSRRYRNLVKRIADKDNVNLQKVMEYLADYGWPLLSAHGQKASAAAFYVIQHAEKEMRDHYYPILRELADRGEADPVQAAMMQDRLLMEQRCKQIYGTQALHPFGKACLIWPIEKPEEMPARRSKAGFRTSFEQDAAEMGATYDPALEITDFSKFL